MREVGPLQVFALRVRLPCVFSSCVFPCAFSSQAAPPAWLPDFLKHILETAQGCGIKHSVLSGFSRGAYWTCEMLRTEAGRVHIIYCSELCMVGWEGP